MMDDTLILNDVNQSQFTPGALVPSSAQVDLGVLVLNKLEVSTLI